MKDCFNCNMCFFQSCNWKAHRQLFGTFTRSSRMGYCALSLFLDTCPPQLDFVTSFTRSTRSRSFCPINHVGSICTNVLSFYLFIYLVSFSFAISFVAKLGTKLNKKNLRSYSMRLFMSPRKNLQFYGT